MEMTMVLNTAVVYGSARQSRQGIKAARFILRQLELRGQNANLVDSEEQKLPLLDRMYKEFDKGEAPETMEKIADIFRNADGFIIVSGEYNHSVPAALKNLLDHFQGEYLYKPSALVTYSAGPFGGVRALVNLRGIMAELGAPSIPSAFPISKVQNSFDDEGNVVNAPYEQRVGKFLDEYEWYADALKWAREKEKCKTEMPVQQTMCRG
jgi:NAD(P)H-dependent FMN reductase